ncbi:MAG: hypothetical protein QM654_15025 [Dysgonamonadaceae bacterium]
MPRNGRNLTTETPIFGRKSLVTKEEEKDIRKEKLVFSFLHFRQIENFGIGNCSSKWHISLIERLSILGTMTTQEVLEDNRGSGSLRCHPIDWSKKNIPIQRTDLEWLPSEILENDSEFPIMQFSLTTGTGRIIGYFNKDTSVFYIILLDPQHNIQPAQKHNWQIQPTTKGISQYDDLLTKIDSIKKMVDICPHTATCKIVSHIKNTQKEHDIVYALLDNDFYSNYQELLKEYTLQEILENGILSLTK